MADPCNVLRDMIQELEHQLRDLEDGDLDTGGGPDPLPPSRLPGLRAAIKRELRARRNQLKDCEANPTLFSVRMEGIEVTQAIQDMQHSVALVARKRTVVRVYLAWGFAFLPEIFVQGELLARSGSGELFTVSSANQPLLRANSLRTMRHDASLSLNFILPAELTAAGDWEFSLSSLVASFGSLEVAPRTLVRRVSFVNAAPLRLRVLGVRYSMGSPPVQFTPSDDDFKLLFSWLRRAYPVAEVVALGALIDISPSAPEPFDAGHVNAQLAAIRALDVSAGADRRMHYYGLVSDGGFFMRGRAAGVIACGPTGSPRPALGGGWDNDGSYGDWYCGHELGHTFGRHHPGSCEKESHDDPIYPFANGQLANDDDSFCGFDSGDPALGLPPAALPGTVWHDVMTYCERQWLSSYTYEGIRLRLADENEPAAPGGGSSGGVPDGGFPQGAPMGTTVGLPENLISVVARVNLSRKEGQIRYVHPVAGGDVEGTVSASPVALVLKTETGELLHEFPVAVKLDSDRDEHADETGLVDAVVATGPEARQIELVIGEKTADTFRAGGPAQPIRDVRRSEGPTAMGLSWEIDAAAGEGMSYSVQASTDEGQTWFTLAVGLKTARFTFDPKQFPGTRRIHIRILATNGFTQTVAPSEVFEVPE